MRIDGETPMRLVLLDEEAIADREHDPVAEGGADDEEDGGEEDERPRVALFLVVQTRSDEHPRLIEQHRAGEEDRGDEGDLQLGEERLGDAGADELDRPGLSASSGRVRKANSWSARL